MKYLGIIGGVIGTVLCLIGTVGGLVSLTHATTAFGYVFGIGVSIMLVILLLNAKQIVKGKKAFAAILRAPLLVSLVMVVVSLWTFTHNVFVHDAIAGPSFRDFIISTLIACAVTFLLSGSPIYLSHIIEAYFDSDDN